MRTFSVEFVSSVYGCKADRFLQQSSTTDTDCVGVFCGAKLYMGCSIVFFFQYMFDAFP